MELSMKSFTSPYNQDHPRDKNGRRQTRMIKSAKENNVAIIAREPLANGFLTGKYNADSTFPPGDIRYNFPRNYFHGILGAAKKLQFLTTSTRTLAEACIRFALDHRDISTVIPGIKNPQQAEENLKSSELPALTGEELLRIKILREEGFV